MKQFGISVAALAFVLMAAGVSAQDYTLGFDGPDSVAGSAGDTASASHNVTLAHAGDGPGAQGWSFGVSADGGAITAVTTDGTTAADVFDGGFNKTTVTTGEGNEGAVSAVVLCFGCPAVIPPNSTGSLLAMDVDWPIGEESSTGTLRFEEGLTGAGQPVDIVVTEEGSSADHVRDSKDVAINVIQSCCAAEYRVGFSLESLNNGVPGEGLIDDDETVCNSSGAATIGTEATVYANVAGDAAEGVQGFSISIEVTGDIDIIGVTTDGTQSAPEPDGIFAGGFNKTRVADSAASGGRRGGVSAVVLCFGCPATYPATGTASIVALTVAGEAEATGSLFFASGLVGEGQPVDNVLTVNGASASVCNIDTARADLTVRGGIGPFERGDANDDGKVNIADSVWIISELFRDGPATTCEVAADANGDLMIDLADAVYVLDYRFDGGPPPSAPFGDCGVVEDETLSCDTPQSNC